MKCPRCVQTVVPGEESCRSCGYSLETPDEQLGRGAVSVERLTDADGLLTGAQRDAAGAMLVEFERRFPQLFLMFYLGALPSPASPRQFGFWLLNHAAIPSLDATRPNERGMVLVVDPVAGSAALTAGYFLECYLRQEELDEALSRGRRDFTKGLWVTALRAIAGSLTEKLIRRAKEAAREPGAFAPPAPPSGLAFPALLRLGEPIAGEGEQESPPVVSPVSGDLRDTGPAIKAESLESGEGLKEDAGKSENLVITPGEEGARK